MAKSPPSTKRPPGRPRLMPLEERRELVLDAAVALVGEEGPAGVSLDEVARYVGVTKPALYEIFPSKDALFEAAVGRELDRLVERLLEAYRVPDAPMPVRTRERVRAVFAYAADNPRRMRLLHAANRERTAGIARLQQAAHERVVAELARIIRTELRRETGQRTSPAAAEALALAMVEMTLAAAQRALEDDRVSLEGMADLVAEFVVGGFASMRAETLAGVARRRR